MTRHLFVLALVVLSGCAHGGTPPAVRVTEANEGIQVVGEGEAEARPDVARFSVGVEVRRPSVADAREAAATAMQRVLEALRGAGLGEEDLSTSQLSIHPEYEHTEQGRNLLGYTASNMVDARVTDLDRLSAAIDAATRAGGDDARLHGLRFEVSDPSATRAEARAEAMDEARATAEQLARLAGVSLGEPIAIQEESIDGGGPRPMMMEMRAADASTPVEPGMTEVRVRLSVRWSIE